MKLSRQLSAYAGIGALQWVLDSAVMIGSSQLGLQVGLATVAGRISGAMLGYWLNGRYTFAQGARNTLGGASLRRFIIFWLLATAASALILGSIDQHFGLRASWLCKPVVDIAFALLGFLAARHWIYRAAG